MRVALWVGGENIQNMNIAQKTAECDRVVCADQGLDHLLAWGLSPVLFVGDCDSCQNPIPPGCEKIFLPKEKDFTDTEIAVKEVLHRNAHEIWLFCGAGKRMDHWLSNLYLIEKYAPITRWYTAHEEIYILKEKSHLLLACKTFSIFPLGKGPWKIQDLHTKWSVSELTFNPGHSLSNETLGGQGELKVIEGRFMVIIPGEPH